MFTLTITHYKMYLSLLNIDPYLARNIDLIYVCKYESNSSQNELMGVMIRGVLWESPCQAVIYHINNVIHIVSFIYSAPTSRAIIHNDSNMSVYGLHINK